MSRVVFDLDSQKIVLDMFSEDLTEIKNNMKTVLTESIASQVKIIGSLLSSSTDRPYEKLEETKIVSDELFYTVPNLGHGMDLNLAENCYQIYFERYQGESLMRGHKKNQSDNIHTYLRSMWIDTVTLIGVNINSSIIEIVEELLAGQYKVEVVTDAIVNFEPIRIKGVKFMTTEEYVSMIRGEDD